ncbi:MAG: hypothetical protein M3450_12470 [Actinomycetota bacterium]|nr:hypothetical protein [Actinomycetota bacterium]
MRRTLRDNGLSTVMFGLFALFLVGMSLAGQRQYNEEQTAHGEERVESFQNWQSEFLAVGALVVLSIYLRQRGSPESKPVAAAHAETGTE